MSSTLVFASKITYVSGVAQNITSLSLTAGDWDVSALAYFEGSATPSTSFTQGSLSTVSATPAAVDGFYAYGAPVTTATSDVNAVMPPTRFSLSSPTTVFLVGVCGILGGTIKGWGYVSARRVR
jgi:hypothetical protein